jgi:tetratricopeptide (TPR) repeat protein
VAAWTKLISALGALLADVDVAAAWASEAVEEFSALDDSWSRASASMSLAFARLQQGDIAAAHAALEKSVPALLAVGDRKMASGCLIARAMAARFAGDLPEAAASYKQALTLCIDAGDPANTPVCLEGLAAAVAARNPQQAAHLLAAARALFDAGYLPMAPGFENFYETTHDLLESELGTELDTLLRAGRITTLDDLSKLELSLAD